ncbi:MAG: isoprenyl transferase, partial [Candidatus Omnitrophica bacterium]|nr:isoprenyl transferase [Candidatus Omnitrophota bacterium]
IMDGNGRWARKRGLPKIAGHRAGVKAAEGVIKAAKEAGVRMLTLYTFSTENWKRPEEEVAALFKMLEGYIDKEEPKLHKNNIRFMAIGRIDELPASLKEKIRRVSASTRGHSSLTVSLALNYGGRQEIVDAARHAALEVKAGRLRPDQIDEAVFSGYLYTKGLPDPDLLIRTSGELRISNFLLWQLSYSEIYVTKKFWPEFKKEDLLKALDDYRNRERRFGG